MKQPKLVPTRQLISTELRHSVAPAFVLSNSMQISSATNGLYADFLQLFNKIGLEILPIMQKCHQIVWTGSFIADCPDFIGSLGRFGKKERWQCDRTQNSLIAGRKEDGALFSGPCETSVKLVPFTLALKSECRGQSAFLHPFRVHLAVRNRAAIAVYRWTVKSHESNGLFLECPSLNAAGT